jgi:hypothetical protein
MKIFRGHMGLGDHIVCNALVRHLAKDDTIIVPVKKHYETSVKFMFSDDPNIIVKPFPKDKKVDKFCRKKAKEGIEVIWNGNLGPSKEAWEKSNSNFDRRFYEQANLDFNLRWDGFKLPENNYDWMDLFHLRFPDIEPTDYIFLHQTSSTVIKRVNRNLIKHDIVFEPDVGFTDNIFDYVGILKNAKEVHCIDSSFLFLADSLNLACKMHYHVYAKEYNPHPPTLRSNWIVHRD